VPTLESLKSFIPKPDRWPISDTWAYHDWHQTQGGRVGPFLDAMDTEFGAATSFEDFVRKAQMLDYSGYRALFEGMAAHLWQPNSGRMIWMTQPAWPSMMWNFLSWDYDTQSSFYATQKALEPVHAQLNLSNGDVDLINLGDARTLKVRVRVLSLENRTLSDQTTAVDAAGNDRTPDGRLDLAKLADGHAIFVVLNVSDTAGNTLSNNFYWWAEKEASLRELDSLPLATVTASTTTSAANGEQQATVHLADTGKDAAVMLKLTLEDAATGKRILPAYYSDNYISLLPGEQRTITVAYPAGAPKPAIALRGWNLASRTMAAP
jgi:Exo-beta-D-glucosaminidase Ig-fold domain